MRYKLGYISLAIIIIGNMVVFAHGYDIVQFLGISKITFMSGVLLILVVILGVFYYINKHEKIHYKKVNDEEKQEIISNIRNLLKDNNVQDDDIKERIEFLEGQNLSKIKEVEKKLQEKIEKNRKDQINEYNFFKPIENIN